MEVRQALLVAYSVDQNLCSAPPQARLLELLLVGCSASQQQQLQAVVRLLALEVVYSVREARVS